jgi:aminoglycoside N3'-acetyltransferase
MNNISNLKSVLGDCISRGDDLLVHSSLRSLGSIPGGGDTVLDLLLDLVADSGTLIMMTATTSFATTQHFSLLNTPSETGTLTEIMRLRKPSNRSFVPMTSFVAAGARESEYLEMFDSYLDQTSPFSKLLKFSGKVILLGVGFDRCTLYHLAEERFQVPYNAYKTFQGTGVDANSEAKPISQTYFVRRDLDLMKDPDRVSYPFTQNRTECFSADFGSRHIYTFKAAAYDKFMTDRLADDNLCLVRSE